jgi:hypothetical protein
VYRATHYPVLNPKEYGKMASKYRRRLAKVTGDTPSDELVKKDFASNLDEIVRAQGMNKSDLARKMWGDTIDKSGRRGAAHRDRITAWTAGSIPDPTNMKLLADTLGVSLEELSAPLVARMVDRERHSLQMIQAAGHPDKVHLRVDKLVNVHIAVQVLALLVKND